MGWQGWHVEETVVLTSPFEANSITKNTRFSTSKTSWSFTILGWSSLEWIMHSVSRRETSSSLSFFLSQILIATRPWPSCSVDETAFQIWEYDPVPITFWRVYLPIVVFGGNRGGWEFPAGGVTWFLDMKCTFYRHQPPTKFQWKTAARGKISSCLRKVPRRRAGQSRKMFWWRHQI